MEYPTDPNSESIKTPLLILIREAATTAMHLEPFGPFRTAMHLETFEPFDQRSSGSMASSSS